MGEADEREQPAPAVPTAVDAWDAGERGCGELVLELRARMAALAPGEVFHLVARDPGAREDLPAWCRMTRNPLRHAAHPHYFLERRRDPLSSADIAAAKLAVLVQAAAVARVGLCGTTRPS